MNQLQYADMERIIGFLPKDLVDLMKTQEVWLAGGYIRARIAGETVSDIDFCCRSKEKAQYCAMLLAESRKVERFKTRNAYTIVSPPRTPVQFIHRWVFDDAAAMIASFDFTISKAAIWYDQQERAWRSTVDARFYADLAARRLVYTFPVRVEEAGGSLLRVQKFLKRGYDISPDDLAKVVARFIGAVDPNSAMWQSSEAGKAKVLRGLLREVDPAAIIDGLEVHPDSLEEEDKSPEELPL